jgi:hypothetical protein
MVHTFGMRRRFPNDAKQLRTLKNQVTGCSLAGKDELQGTMSIQPKRLF